MTKRKSGKGGGGERERDGRHFFFVCVKHRKAKRRVPVCRSSRRPPHPTPRNYGAWQILECEKIAAECVVNAWANTENVFFIFIPPLT